PRRDDERSAVHDRRRDARIVRAAHLRAFLSARRDVVAGRLRHDASLRMPQLPALEGDRASEGRRLDGNGACRHRRRADRAARRARIVRQLLVESALLGLAGGAAGLLLSAWGVPLLATLAPTTMSRLAGAHVDVRVVAFSLAISLATSLLFGLLPSIRASRID